MLVTHDKGLALGRRDMPIGRLLWLRCREWDASTLIVKAFEDDDTLLELLRRKRGILVELSLRSDRGVSVTLHFGTRR